MPLSSWTHSKTQGPLPVLLGIFLVCRRLPCESSDLQDLFVATSSARPLLYQPVPKVCEYAFKRRYLCCVFLCREQFFNSVSSRGHIWTSWSLKVFVCVCVCVRDTLANPYYPLCVNFREQSCLWHRVSGAVFLFSQLTEGHVRVDVFEHCFALYFVVHLTVTYISRLK